MHKRARTQVRVRAVFPHSSLLFDLPADACKADLARIIERFGETRGAPLYVNVILPCRQASRREARRSARLAGFSLSS